ncbi:hypothetical protein KSW29_06975 [Bifidobacterium adolescentis]|jgi:hypothetical protein|uniref:hypothetical protein n=1 Tax=Bifidobacterium adolescentis TaxID=1680 RepID=UPI001C378BE3|nr:hypothetical protein [Bifidobacterium adolescentis]MBV3434926.1 hypothetical protein [Bifidobacterium adolescentis]
MKKKIVAILATIAAVFGFGFAANSAMAVDQYGATGKVEGSTVTFTFTNLPKGRYYVASESEAVSAITLAAAKSNIVSITVDNGTATATFTVKASCNDTKVTATLYNADTNEALTSADVTVPATGDCETTTNGSAQTANTGAAIAPYIVAVVLLAAAGISLVAVRKSSAR